MAGRRAKKTESRGGEEILGGAAVRMGFFIWKRNQNKSEKSDKYITTSERKKRSGKKTDGRCGSLSGRRKRSTGTCTTKGPYSLYLGETLKKKFPDEEYLFKAGLLGGRGNGPVLFTRKGMSRKGRVGGIIWVDLEVILEYTMQKTLSL